VAVCLVLVDPPVAHGDISRRRMCECIETSDTRPT
jgi:hypothetical protein